MSERCIVRIKFTPAGGGAEVRRAVGGFLRYVQHRDVHPDHKARQGPNEVSGLLKYVAYRDRANTRAELFGPSGAIGSQERKEFGEFVASSLENSKPELFRARDGGIMDRRRAVSRLIISPERAQGLDLEALTRAAVARLQAEAGIEGLRWIAAIHRNTNHHHVHLVVAGMVGNGAGGYRRADVTKPRLRAMKEAVTLEIERQRSERAPAPRHRPLLPIGSPSAVEITTGAKRSTPQASERLRVPALLRVVSAPAATSLAGYQQLPRASSLVALRAVARRYSRRMQWELEREARLRGWERAA